MLSACQVEHRPEGTAYLYPRVKYNLRFFRKGVVLHAAMDDRRSLAGLEDIPRSQAETGDVLGNLVHIVPFQNSR